LALFWCGAASEKMPDEHGLWRQRTQPWLFAAAVATVACAVVLATRLPAEADDDDGMSAIVDILDGSARMQLMATLVAVRIPELVCCANASLTAGALASSVSLPLDVLHRLLRAADAAGLLRYPADAPNGEAHVAARSPLCHLVPPDASCATGRVSLAPLVQLRAGLHAGAWAQLPAWVAERRRQQTPFEMHTGRPASEFFARGGDPRWIALDAQAVEQRARPAACLALGIASPLARGSAPSIAPLGCSEGLGRTYA
tara:strand:- start:345 stop:1115 length:771 start_codon:yes stop_codon:yes gene_type:complete